MTAQEVVFKARNTCRLWKEISLREDIWHGITFTPKYSWSEDQIETFLSYVPQLKRIIFKHRRQHDFIMRDLCQKCEDVRSIIIRDREGPSIDMLCKVMERFKKLECLESSNKTVNSSYDWAKLYGEYHKSRRFKFLGSSASLTQLAAMVKLKKDNLQILALKLSVTTENLEIICRCVNLKYLLLTHEGSDTGNIEIKYLSNLRHLETLHLLEFPDSKDNNNLTWFDDCLFNDLKHLDIIDGGTTLRFAINDLLLSCPKLRHLGLHGNNLNEDLLTNIVLCKDLEYIDVSNNYDLGDSFLDIIALNCKKVQHLDIANCRNVTDRFVVILQECESLITILVEGHYLTGEFLIPLVMPYFLPNLEEINLGHITDRDTLTDLLIEKPLLIVEQCANEFDQCLSHCVKTK